MEKRTFALFIGISLFLFSASVTRVLAYSVETHAFLTDTVFDFYNQRTEADKKLSEELRSFLVDGSRREDDAPRWMNHFYDPVYNRGLTSSVLGTWQASKEWARDEENQNKPTYKVPATIASILTAIQQRSIVAISAETNFTWQQAIRYWLNGEREKAMFMLGHVVHLIEDAAVPEHTRNDPHPGDSPYEDWTGQFTLVNPDTSLASRLAGRDLTIVDDLGSHFDQLATFTNSGFYSKDTIGVQSGYQFPVPDFDITTADGIFATRSDNEFGDVRLFRKLKGGSYLLENEANIVFDDDSVMSDYWLPLSTRAVQYSAGVIDLFFREVARAEQDPSFLGEEPESFVANALDTVQNFFTSAASAVTNVANDVAAFTQNVISKIQNEPENVGEIVGESVEQIEQILAGDSTDGIVIDTEEERAQLKELQNQLDDISDQIDDLAYQVDAVTGEDGKGGAQEVVEGAEDTDGADDVDISSVGDINISSGSGGGGGGGVAASAPNIVITEIMYNASGTDNGREWIEIKNDGTSSRTFEGVKFLEGGVNHKIVFASGSASLASGAYAVIANDSTQFLVDYPAFSGNLSDSTFSFLNDGETLALTWSGSTFHSISYSSSTGAYGDGDSLQLMNGAWQAGVPTPGAVNVVASASSGGGSSGDDESTTSTATSSPPTAGFGSYHVLISEVQVAGVDAGDEFIELYNPTDAAVDVSEWSLQYAGAGAEITSSTMADRKKNFLATSSITAKGFYLVGHGLSSTEGNDGYSGSVVPDMTHRSFSLSGASAGAKVFLVVGHNPIESESDPRILDVFDYTSTTVPGVGESLERRAWSNNLCHSVIPGGSGEFLGNGCDTGVFADDFELRASSNPQNAQSFIEPRAAPTVPAAGAPAFAEYVRDSVSIHFAWEPSNDFQGATSTVTYHIRNASTSATIYNGTSMLFSQTLTEVGRSYSYTLQAFDRDGMGSATSSLTVDAPSFLDALYFYPDPFATSSRYAVDLYYDSYPFIPHRWSSGSSSRVAVFYLNRVPSTERDFVTHSISGGVTIPTDMQSGLLAMKFRDCGGQQDQISPLPILPDSSDNCATAGPYVDDVAFFLLEDPHLRFILASSSSELVLTGSDYLTVAFYDYSSPTWACSCRMFSLVATDAAKYYFSSVVPAFAAPELPDLLTTEFDDASSRIIVRWATSTDSDTLDNLITYEIAFSTSTIPSESEWQSAGPQPHADLDDVTFISHRYLRHVVPDESFTIGVRAADEFGVTSTPRTTVWQYRSVSEMFSQGTSTGWSFPWGEKTTGPCSTCPVRASLQSIVSTSSLTFDVATVKVWQEGSGSPSTLRLGVFANDDTNNRPLLTDKLREATLGQLGLMATSTDLAFTFFSPITLEAGTKYWLGIDVTASGWNGTSGLFGSRWRNAIATGNEYGMGEAGLGAVEECIANDYCGTTIPSPSGDADWYLKLYLRQ